jgi:hypothetical protein
MGNIVSNPVQSGQVPSANTTGASSPSPQYITPPDIPGTVPTASSTTIEGTTPSPAQAGYGVDPFGPVTPPAPTPAIQPSEPEPPSITVDPPPPTTPPLITTPSDQVLSTTQLDAATILSKIPDVGTMMKDLEKSGCLLPDLKVNKTLHVDTSPLAALQPNRLKDQGNYISTPGSDQPKPVLPEVQLATTSVPEQKQHVRKDAGELPLFVFTAIICLIQVVQGATQVAHFFLIRYPQYEKLVINGQLTTTDVNATVIKAVFIAAMVFISLPIFLAVILKRAKNHSALLYISVVVIILNFCVQNIMAGSEFVSGSPLVLPSILSEIFSSR